jgi:PadR family transcriptional regulator, regulatory protein PadR
MRLIIFNCPQIPLMAKDLRKKSEESFIMSEGTLYPALKRLESKEFIVSYWSEGENGNRRKYYSLTEDGRKELTRKLSSWNKINLLIKKCSEEYS